MDWLIITENAEKAAAIRKAVPNATVVSSQGLPWRIEITIEGGSILYQRPETEKHKIILRNIETAAAESDRILLAFDPTTRGEATAVGFETLLDKDRCARWTCQSLDERDIRTTLAEMEIMRGKDMPKSSIGLAESYWVQSTIDITWANLITSWLSDRTSRKEKWSRLMAGLLKTIVDKHHRQELFVPRRYWELECRVKIPGETGRGHQAYVIVPAFAQLVGKTTTKTQEIWRGKIQEARTAAAQGRGLPQPEPGHPWRYDGLEEIIAHKAHIEKFPYFGIESKMGSTRPTQGKPPVTNWGAIEAGTEAKLGTPEEIQTALNELYMSGWITHPLSNNPNLAKKTVEKLVAYGTKAGIVLDKEAKKFGDPRQHERWAEAIRPTNWERTPERANALIPESIHRTRKVWLYRLIYQRALESQLPNAEENTQRCFLLGPLYVRRRTARENWKGFKTVKETKLVAHMNLIISSQWSGEESPEENTVVECLDVKITERKIDAPKELTEEGLFTKMEEEGLGKRDTLRKQLVHLRKLDCITHTGIELTPKGESISKILNRHFAQFLDNNYHREIANSLLAIERNELDSQEFLKEWWDCVRTYLEEEEEEEE